MYKYKIHTPNIPLDISMPSFTETKPQSCRVSAAAAGDLPKCRELLERRAAQADAGNAVTWSNLEVDTVAEIW